MQENIYDKINEQTDIVALVSEYVDLEKKGKNYMGLCPFHDEKTPSFSVTPEKNLAYCFGCKKGGAPITFLSQIKNISAFDAAKELAEKLGIPFGQTTQKVKDPNETLYQLMKDASSFYQFALKNSESGQKAYNYLLNRKLDDNLINHFEIGYAPDQIDGLYKMLRSKKYSVSDMMSLGLVKQNEQGHYYDVFRNRITFPIKNNEGYIVGFSARTLNPREKAKYINSTETPIFKKGHLLYHYSDSIRPAVKQKHVILHEGYFDVLASYKAGYEAVVATMGTAVTNEQATLLRRITKHVVLGYDGDNAGIDATLKVIPVLKRNGLDVSVLNLQSGFDPDDFVLKKGVNAYQKLMEQRLDPYQFGYTHFQKGKDFKKSDDITAYKQAMSTLLSGADPTIIDLYERRSYNELGIQLLIHDKKSSLPVKRPVVSKDVIKRSERAFDELLIELLISRKYFDIISSKIKITEVTQPEKRELYKEIMNYYLAHPNEDMDLELFKKAYTKHVDLVDAFCQLSKYKKRLTIINEISLENIILKFKEYQIQLDIDTYIMKSQQAKNTEEQNKYLSLVDQLRKQVKKI